MIRIAMALSIVMLWQVSAEAGNSNYEPTYPPHVTRATAEAKSYYIEFRARTEVGGYGHAYVALGAVDVAGHAQETVVIGFMPKGRDDDYWSQFALPVRGTVGVVRSDVVGRPAIRFRVAIGKAKYDQVVSSIHRLRSRWTAYDLLGRNCNSFVGQVADSIGLRTPTLTAQYPVSYISELRALNSR
jgi:hypothetical protein